MAGVELELVKLASVKLPVINLAGVAPNQRGEAGVKDQIARPLRPNHTSTVMPSQQTQAGDEVSTDIEDFE